MLRLNGCYPMPDVTPDTIENLPRGGMLPHEWCFGGFLGITGLRLAWAGGAAWLWAGLFLGCLAASLGVIVWSQRNPTSFRWRIRLLFYPAVMGITFFAMGPAVPLLGQATLDARLLAWDRWLLGETPSVSWISWAKPWLVDVAMAGYLFFFVYLVVGPGIYCLRGLSLFRKCIVGLFTLYGLGFLCYTLFPAGGPHRFLEYATPLKGVWLFEATLKPVNDGSNAVDAFPSIHFAATLYLLLFDWKHYRARFWCLLGPCLLLWFSTLFLRFHYFIDLVAGLVVALIGWWIARPRRSWNRLAEK